MSQFSDYAHENLLAAQRQASTIEDRDTRMAVQSLIHVVQTFTAAQERREHMRRVPAMTKLSPKTIPEPDMVPQSIDEYADLAQHIVAARAALSEYIALCHQRGLRGYVPKQIARADRALRGLDNSADTVHTDGMDTATTEQED